MLSNCRERGREMPERERERKEISTGSAPTSTPHRAFQLCIHLSIYVCPRLSSVPFCSVPFSYADNYHLNHRPFLHNITPFTSITPSTILPTVSGPLLSYAYIKNPLIYYTIHVICIKRCLSHGDGDSV